MADATQPPFAWRTSLCLLLLLLLFCLSSASRPPSFRPRTLSKPLRRHHSLRSSSITYETRYFTQRLDHFGFQPSSSSFQQRYLLNSEHWIGANRSGPIFFYCGNEGEIVWFAENTGLVWELAPMFGALVLFPEHRYYGESMPFGSQDAAYKDANSLAYLTSEQALADFVLLLRDLKRNLSAEACPVVLFGGSYGGMLAAWMRLKYPHVSIGAIASSAPILQFEDVVPTDSYYKIVSNDFKRESSECYDLIQQSWNELEAAGEEDGGLQQLTKKFQLCRELNSTSELEDWISSAYSYLAMTDYPYAADFVMPLPAFPIREVCIAMNQTAGSTLSKVFAGISVFYNYTGEETCFDIDDDPHGMDGWNWQACTEMIMPMSSNPNNSMFPPGSFDLGEYEDWCLESYGVMPRAQWITSEFGGHNIYKVLKNFGSNIVFSNGLLDPWSGGGILRNISSSIVALVTEEGAHHLDLRFSSENDPQWLTEQRQTEIKHIEGWLLQYYEEQYIPIAEF